MQVSYARRPILAIGHEISGSTSVCRNASIIERFAQLRVHDANAAVEGRRRATVRSQGAYKQRSNKTIPKKMGAKRVGDQYVIPGNILYKQRGTIWHPGENAIRGRDFTIHAAVAGYVKYYRDPELHPTRQYIGVAFERTDTLPYPKNAPRHRKLAKIAVPRKEPKVTPKLSASGIRTSVTLAGDAVSFISVADAKAATAADGTPVILPEPRKPMQPKAAATPRQFFLRDDYSYREANWRLGRLAGPVGEQIGSQRKYSRSARFRTLARKKDARQQKVKEMAAENKRVKVAARAQELARKAEDEARVAAELKKREARFAELEAAESAGKQAESPNGVRP